MAEPHSSIITLYDIPRARPNKAWSPSTWLARYCLNYKGLAYETVWVEYPDIEKLCIKIGAKHTSVVPDGSRKQYTLPVIHDKRTGVVISDSIDIAEYLDATYPDTPPVFPKGTKALQVAFSSSFDSKLSALFSVLTFATYSMLNEASKPYYRQTREAMFGKKLEDLSPIGPVRDGHVKQLKNDWLDVVDGWLSKGDSGQAYIAGSEPSYVDFVVASRLKWLKLAAGDDSEEWKEVRIWHGGRWVRSLKSVEKYEAAE